MLAVAVASPLSRAISYGTIYTTKLLRRGIDIDGELGDEIGGAPAALTGSAASS
jgi:hypothetical protein